MKLLAIILMIAMVVTLSASVMAGPGPAPNSHDGISDGPGWEEHPSEWENPENPAPYAGEDIPGGSEN